MMIHALHASVLNASSRLIPGEAIRNSSRGRTPGPEQHGEEDPDEHERAAEVGLLEHQEERHADDQAGADEVPERAGWLLPARRETAPA